MWNRIRDYTPPRNAVTTFHVVSSTKSVFFVIPCLKGMFCLSSDFIMHASSRCRGSALYRLPPRTIAWAIFHGLSVFVHGDRYILPLSCLRMAGLTALFFTPPAVQTCVYIRRLITTPLYVTCFKILYVLPRITFTVEPNRSGRGYFLRV